VGSDRQLTVTIWMASLEVFEPLGRTWEMTNTVSDWPADRA
jgi:hypothetical protein